MANAKICDECKKVIEDVSIKIIREYKKSKEGD